MAWRPTERECVCDIVSGFGKINRRTHIESREKARESACEQERKGGENRETEREREKVRGRKRESAVSE